MEKSNKREILKFVFITILLLIPLFIFAGAPKILSVTIDPPNPGYPGFCNMVTITVSACVHKYTNSYISIAFSKYNIRQTVATPGQVFVVSYDGVSPGTESINPNMSGDEIGYLFAPSNGSATNDCTDCGSDTNSWTVTRVYNVYFPDPQYFLGYGDMDKFYLHVGMKDSYFGKGDWIGISACQSYTLPIAFDSAYLYYDPVYKDIVAPSTVNVGQVFTVKMSVTNIGGGTSYLTTVDSLSYTGTATISYMGRIGPTHVTPSSGATNTFEFVYAATSAGGLCFSGYAKGVDGATGNTIVSRISCTWSCMICFPTNCVNIQTPASLSTSIVAYPSTVNLGNDFTVVMSVTNTGQATANNVYPSSLIKFGPGNSALVSGPVPASVNIFGGGSAFFTWTYSATGVGSVAFTGNASGVDANSGATVTSSSSMSNFVFIITSTPTPTMTITRTPTPTVTQTVSLTRTMTATFTPTITVGTPIPTPGFTVIIDDIAGGADKGEQIVKLPDGSFLIVGIVWDDGCTCYISVIWKYRADGTLDTSFGGGDGIMECPVPGTTFVWEDGVSIYVDISGYIYVTAYVIGCGGTCKNLVVYRCNPDGTIDTSFGSGLGYIIYTQISVNISVSVKSYITFDSIGRMIITCKRWNGTNYDMIVMRCNPDGSLDTTFCAGMGYCIYDYAGGDDAGYKVYVDINFNIYIVGYVTVFGPGCTPSCKAIAVWKLLPNGTPDPSFNGGNCYIYYDILKNHLNCEAFSIVVTVTDEIYITGYVDDGSGCVITCKKMIVIKLTASGTIDITFGINGIYVFETYPGIGVDIGIDFDGKLVVAGTIHNGISTDMILWKLLITGTLDFTHNSIGYGIYDSGRDDWCKGMTIYALCTYLLTGYVDVIGSNYDMLVWFDGCSKYPTPTSTRTRTPTLTPTNTPTYSATQTITYTNTPTITITVTFTPTLTATPTATYTDTQTYTSTMTITATFTFTVTQTPFITPPCDGVTTPTYTVHLIYNPEHSDYVVIEIESSTILQTAPVIDVYPHCGCPPDHKVVLTYTAELIPGETKKYRVLYPKQTGWGDIDKVIVKGTDVCNVYGESDGSYTKETISRQDLIIYKNVINPDKNERSRIVFKIYGGGDYKVNVYNRNGVLIKGLFDENIKDQSGEREVIWDGTNSAGKKVVSGIYIVVAKSPYYEAKAKIVVLR